MPVPTLPSPLALIKPANPGNEPGSRGKWPLKRGERELLTICVKLFFIKQSSCCVVGQQCCYYSFLSSGCGKNAITGYQYVSHLCVDCPLLLLACCHALVVEHLDD